MMQNIITTLYNMADTLISARVLASCYASFKKKTTVLRSLLMFITYVKGSFFISSHLDQR